MSVGKINGASPQASSTQPILANGTSKVDPQKPMNPIINPSSQPLKVEKPINSNGNGMETKPLKMEPVSPVSKAAPAIVLSLVNQKGPAMTNPNESMVRLPLTQSTNKSMKQEEASGLFPTANSRKSSMQDDKMSQNSNSNYSATLRSRQSSSDNEESYTNQSINKSKRLNQSNNVYKKNDKSTSFINVKDLTAGDKNNGNYNESSNESFLNLQ
jgi:hypothetical protein